MALPKNVRCNTKIFNLLNSLTTKFNISKTDILHNAIKFWNENELYQEFAKTPASALLETKFKLNNEILMGLKNALNDAWMKQQQALNEQNKTMQMLNEQLKMQSKQIAVVNKTLLAILEEKE